MLKSCLDSKVVNINFRSDQFYNQN